MSITADDVKEVVEVDDSISLIPFIAAANELVTELCSDSEYTSTRIDMICVWLSAHFYLIRDQAVASERAGDVGVNYQYQIGLNLQQTKQGQMAMTLDTAGNLAALSKRIEEGKSSSIHIGWLGTDYDTEEEDDDN